jgi:hypothetical protein
MLTTITTQGLGAIAQALASDKKLNVTRWRFGGALNVPLNNGNVIDVVDFIGEGESGVPHEGVIVPNFFGPNMARFLLRLSSSVGPYLPGIGNIMLFTDDGVPFIFGSLANAQPKEVGQGGDVTGNELEFYLTVKVENIQHAVAVPILLEDCTALPISGTQYDLPWPPGTDPYNSYLVDNHTATCAPFVAHRSLTRDTWFGTPFSQDVRSTNFGTFDSGVALDSFLTRTTMDYGTYLDRRLDSDRDPDNPQTLAGWLDFDGGEYTAPLSPSPTWTEVFDFGEYSYRRVPPPVQNDVPLVMLA